MRMVILRSVMWISSISYPFSFMRFSATCQIHTGISGHSMESVDRYAMKALKHEVLSGKQWGAIREEVDAERHVAFRSTAVHVAGREPPCCRDRGNGTRIAVSESYGFAEKAVAPNIHLKLEARRRRREAATGESRHRGTLQ